MEKPESLSKSHPLSQPVAVDDSERRLEDFTVASQDWYWEMDSDLRYTWISSNIEKKFDIKRESLYGKMRTQVSADSEDKVKWAEHNAILAERKSFQNFDYKLQIGKGVIHWARTSGFPFFNADGDYCGYRGTATDVTHIKQIEEKALQASNHFRLASDHFSGGLVLFDQDKRVVQYSLKLLDIFDDIRDMMKPGWSLEPWLRAQLAGGLVPEAIGCEEAWLNDRLNPNSSDGTREVLRGGRWYRVTSSMIPGGGWLQTMLDINEQKNIELEMDEDRNLLRSIIDNISDLIYAKDLDSNFIVANNAIAQTLETENGIGADLIGKNDFTFHEKSLAEGFLQSEEKILQHGDCVFDELSTHIDKPTQKPYWISTNKAPLRDTSGKIVGLVGCGRDVTRQLQLTDEIEKNRARARDFADAAADWFWECDGNLKITFLSDRCLELIDDSREALYGMTLLEFVTRLDLDSAHSRKFALIIERGDSFNDYELTFGKAGKSPRYFGFSGKPYFNGDNYFSGYRGAGRDVTEAKTLQDQISYQANHDMLTRLANRQQFENILGAELVKVKSLKTAAVVGYLDMDQFKIINDTAGHRAGDQLLCQVAELMKSSIGHHVIARLGGDEFGLLFTDITVREAQEHVHQIIKILRDFRFVWDEQIFVVGASVGLVEITPECENITEILSHADMACFAAKDLGRNRSHVFTHDDEQLNQRHHEMLASAGISSALENDRFCLYMQPIASIATESLDIHHCEVLLRMLDENQNVIPPGAFIPAAERFGLMNAVDRWVVKNALASFNEVFAGSNSLGITINLSGSSMTDETLFAFIQEYLEKYQVDPKRVCFEITETAVINHLEVARQFMLDIKSIGCSLALDDFGSGLSSFTYLKHFDVDYLKIDGSFVRDMVSDQSDRVVVTAINEIGHGMNLKTIAEFVENDAILDVLRELGVDYAQGYGIGKPVPFVAENLMLARNTEGSRKAA